MKRKAEGTITVFLSLILLLVLSLLLTLIESARVGTAKVSAERALMTAMDSVMAEYYGPLWEEYHIFGYYSGEAQAAQTEKKMEETITEYMQYTLSPEEQLGGNMMRTIHLQQVSVADTNVTHPVSLTEYEGELLLNEAVEYMKYRELGNGAEMLLKKLKLLETPEKVSYLSEEKLKVEEELVKIDLDVLKLMELLDGITTNKKGIELTDDGSLGTTVPFIKILCYEAVTQESVGINHDVVFKAQKENYINPDNYFISIREILNQLQQRNTRINALGNSLSMECSDLEQEQLKLNNLLAKQDNSTLVKEQMKSLKEVIAAKTEVMKGLQNQISEENGLLEQDKTKAKATIDQLQGIFEKLTPLMNEAVTLIDEILVQLEYAAPLIKHYEELLGKEVESLDEVTYQGLEEGLAELKKYIVVEDGGYDFAKMKEILLSDRAILIAGINSLTQARDNIGLNAWSEAEASVQAASVTLTAYQIKELTLDYSTLIIDRSSKDTPLNEINNLLRSGVLSLVLNPDSISAQGLSNQSALPSELHELTDEKQYLLTVLTSFFQDAADGIDSDRLGSVFQGFQNGTQISKAFTNTINSVAQELLYQAYVTDHFGSYQNGSVEQSRKPSVLEYEQEYLLAGENTDQKNLDAVVSQIVFSRTVLDFVSIIGNSKIRAEAKLAAASLVGFTGLPILISITQGFIMIIWAFAEALLDTCALLMGKEVPVIKKDVTMQFADLFLLNRGYLQQKASQLTNTKEISFSYQDYLRVFLLLKGQEKLAYRSMDLIQENIILRYQEEDFQIQNCLFGYEAESTFVINYKFTAFSFIKQYIRAGTGSFSYKVNAACSY